MTKDLFPKWFSVVSLEVWAKEEIIRLRRVLPKTFCVCLSKMTVPIRLLMNPPATFHSEGSSLHLRRPSGSGMPRKCHWGRSHSVQNSWKYVIHLGTQGSCMAIHSNVIFSPLTTYWSQSAGVNTRGISRVTPSVVYRPGYGLWVVANPCSDIYRDQKWAFRNFYSNLTE